MYKGLCILMFFSLLVLLTASSAPGQNRNLFFDDFEGDELDADKWEVAQWAGAVTVEAADGRCTLLTEAQASRAGILSVSEFNADNEMISVTVGGCIPDSQLIVGMYFGDGNTWGNSVEMVSGEAQGNTTGTIWFIGGAGEVSGSWNRAELANEMTTRKEGDFYNFIQKYDNAEEYTFEIDDDTFGGDFKVFIYAYHLGQSSFDSVSIYTGEEDPGTAVYPGGKLAGTWGELKASR